jgi:hypothetical protein
MHAYRYIDVRHDEMEYSKCIDSNPYVHTYAHIQVPPTNDGVSKPTKSILEIRKYYDHFQKLVTYLCMCICLVTCAYT